MNKGMKIELQVVQVILFEIDCAIFYTKLHELFCQFIRMEKFRNDLIIINL